MPEVRFPTPRFAPDYWSIEFEILFPAPVVKCPKNRLLRRNRARHKRREYENTLSALLSHLETLTGFPAHFRDHNAKRRAGDGTPFYNAWPITVQTYALGEDLARRAAEFARGLPAKVTVEQIQR